MEDNRNTSPQRPTVIEWQTESSESQLEQVSPDGRWHLDTKTSRDGKPRVYLSNYDLLCGPSGLGETALDCWRMFVEKCDSFAKTLAAVREEAAAILANLEQQP